MLRRLNVKFVAVFIDWEDVDSIVESMSLECCVMESNLFVCRRLAGLAVELTLEVWYVLRVQLKMLVTMMALVGYIKEKVWVRLSCRW